MFAVCNASVPLAELELESLFWLARRKRGWRDASGTKSVWTVSGVLAGKSIMISSNSAGETPALQNEWHVLHVPNLCVPAH